MPNFTDFTPYLNATAGTEGGQLGADGFGVGSSAGGGFDWMSLLAGGAGAAFGGLFGGGGGHGGDKYRGSEVDNLRRLSGVGDQYSRYADTNLKNYYKRSGQADAATDSLAAYLQQDPNTNTHDAAWLNQALAGSSSANQSAAAQMTARNGASGLVTADSGPGSSTAAGQNVALAAMQSNNVANAQNALAANKIAQRRTNMNDLVSLLTGARNTAGSSAMGGLQGESGVYDDLASRYGSLADYMDKRKSAEQAQQGQQIGQFASMIASLFA